MINKLRNLEYGCVLESSEVSNKYSLTFLERMQEAIINDSISIMECDKLLSDNQKKYSLMLDDSLNQLQTTKVDPDKLSNFFTKAYNSIVFENLEITIPVRRLTDVEKIRPQYLTQMMSDVITVCNKITNNEITSPSQLDPYTSQDYIFRYKKQLVKTNIPTNLGDKLDMLLNYGKPILCEVNREFFQTTCMPFLRSYNYNVKELGDTNNAIRSTFSKCYADIKTYLKTVDTLKKSGKLSEMQFSLLRQYLFNATNNFLAVTSYVVFMAIRRINDYTFNMNSFIYLYNEIVRYYPEADTVLHESVMDGTFDDLNHADIVFDLVRNNSSTLKVIADRILAKIKTDLSINTDNTEGDLFHSIIDVNSDSKDYDIAVYDNINDIFVKVNQDLDTLRANMNDEFILVDDLFNKSNFDVKLTSRFISIIPTISNIECYTGAMNGDNNFSKSDVILTIINELNHFNENIDTITQNIYETYNNIQSFKDRLDSNINNEFPNDSTRLEVLDKVIELEVDFSDLVMQIEKEILDRLHALSDTCDHAEYDTEDPDDKTTDGLDFENMENYAEMALEFELDMIEKEYQFLTESMTSEFNSRFLEKKYGIDVFTEAITQFPDPNKKNGEGGPVVVNKNDQETEQKEVENSKVGTKEDNTPQQKLKSKTFISDLSSRVVMFFKTIISKFVGMIKKQTGTNFVWLTNNAASIMRRKQWNGIEITLDKNYDIENFGRKLQTYQVLATNLTTLTADKINSFKSVDELDKFLFSFLTKLTGDIKQDINTYFYTKDGSETPLKYSGSGARRFTESMIKYVSDYYQGGSENLAAYANKISTTLDNTVKKLEAVEPSTVRHIVAMCQYFTGTSMNAYRDGTYSCLKALKQLVPKTSNVQTDQTQNQEQQPAEQTQ